MRAKLAELAEPGLLVTRVPGRTPAPLGRALVLFATFTSLRFGGLASLRRSDVHLATAQVRVRSSQAELAKGRTLVKSPKSTASRRTVTMPAVLVSELGTHLNRHAAAGADGIVFVGPKGGVLRRRNFHRTWTAAVRRAGLSNLGLHFHDLRHTGEPPGRRLRRQHA